MPLLLAENAPNFALPSLSVTGLAAPSRGARESSVWRLKLEPGAPAVEHSLDHEEIFVALAGSARATLDGQGVDVRAGDTLIVPAGTSFSLANPNAETFDALAVAPVGIRAKLLQGEAFAPPWTV